VNSDQEFAKGIYILITGFLSGIDTNYSLEKFYKTNISAIHTMRDIDTELYNQLIDKFKEQRHAINTDRLRQEHTHQADGREGPRATEEEDKRSRKERARQLAESHPSARFWKR
tara:strand:+ start:291 stop:632 length:342 start_codon:yes stop_codon:yes gene_type:complete